MCPSRGYLMNTINSTIIYLNNSGIRYCAKVEYTSELRKKIPTDDLIERWAKGVHNVFKSEDYYFEIKHYKTKDSEPIHTLSFY
jgi:hypothetical protein